MNHNNLNVSFCNTFPHCTLRYHSATGEFAVPLDKDGLYYFYAHIVITVNSWGRFELMKNSETLCVMDGDSNDSPTDHDTITCAATRWLKTGKHIPCKSDPSVIFILTFVN